jgi:hypothetical protein
MKGVWHNEEDDGAEYKHGNPTQVCFSCLDENKVLAWLNQEQQKQPVWWLGYECADVTTTAIAAGLPDTQTKPNCGCSPDPFKQWKVVDLLQGGMITGPWATESRIQELKDNNCQRYKCVLGNIPARSPKDCPTCFH